MAGHQESLGIDSHQIHHIVKLIRRNVDNLLHRIELVFEVSLVCSILRESNNSNLFDFTTWCWQILIIPTENRMNRRNKLIIGI
jgi:hypothetical protein